MQFDGPTWLATGTGDDDPIFPNEPGLQIDRPAVHRARLILAHNVERYALPDHDPKMDVNSHNFFNC